MDLTGLTAVVVVAGLSAVLSGFFQLLVIHSIVNMLFNMFVSAVFVAENTSTAGTCILYLYLFQEEPPKKTPTSVVRAFPSAEFDRKGKEKEGSGFFATQYWPMDASTDVIAFNIPVLPR
ncbi:hypothetical protein RvY_00126 [Ramazzottius varieornatus]|uniref:Uncharacterized protein n=1 Tax=Ramazzottius varieornatus TaxID=947166 RepID=A0A1D1UBM0_RAMVA|nr:hypothetical protein RvY_00126 [Ramazzottius varieornatus]